MGDALPGAGQRAAQGFSELVIWGTLVDNDTRLVDSPQSDSCAGNGDE